MVELALLPFQIKASTEIANKFQLYMKEPLLVKENHRVPFYQNLASITGSGKTLILADTVEQLRARLPVEPIVLWLSKGKVVVWQTLANLSSGGKYAHLLGGYHVQPLLECRPSDVEDSLQGLLLVATVGKFNQKDKDQGGRKIFQVGLDDADKSLWDMLRERRDRTGTKRPLIVVYDEGHNLSNQQTQLLLELRPDALIAASATTKVPEELSLVIDRLRRDQGWADGDLVTTVRSADVVAAGLIKKHLMLGGYKTPMEIAVNDMLAEMEEAYKAAESLGLSFKPKAIYVSTTNTTTGVSIKDDMARPFEERRARPILIWRHLVNSGVSPEEIAVYCDLKFSQEFPPPTNFNLFAGGDADYDKFTAGNYRHIIFNLSLQEGWDDPECGFAYIDKDMGSADQVTQVIGRVLRQPGAQHYPPAILNTAHFFIRTDEDGVFESILTEVERKLVADTPEVSITVRKSKGGGNRPTRPAIEGRVRALPIVSVNAEKAHDAIKDVVSKTMDFRKDTSNTLGKGQRIRVLRSVGTGNTAKDEWVDAEHSNRVTARWVFVREIQRSHPKAVSLCDTEHPRFDAFVEFTSPAADHLREQADKVVKEYVSRSVIVQNALDNPYVIGSVPVDESSLYKFKNAIHKGYSDLNPLEVDFARAIDSSGLLWYRNPSQSAYGIPLLDFGGTETYYPDFLVWTEDEKYIVAIDTKGDHLINKDADRKLFQIEKVEDGPELILRLVTEGEWHVRQDGQFAKATGSKGFTVWLLRQGKLHTVHCKDAKAAVKECVSIE